MSRRKDRAEMTARQRITDVIKWARGCGFNNIAAELSDVLCLMPDADSIEQILTSEPKDHEEGRRIAWLRARLGEIA